MPRLDPERLQEIRDDVALFPTGHTPPTEAELQRAFQHRRPLLEHITHLETEIEDATAAYHLASARLDTHRKGEP